MVSQTEIVKSERTGFLEKIISLVLYTLSLRCQWDIQVEMFQKQLEILGWNSEAESGTRAIYLGVICIEGGSQSHLKVNEIAKEQNIESEKRRTKDGSLESAHAKRFGREQRKKKPLC